MTSPKEEQPRNRSATTKRKIWLAIIYGLLATIFTIIAFSILDNTLLFVASAFLALIFGRLSFRHFKPRYTGDFIDKKLSDKPPVLFLRPFSEDAGWDGAAAFSIYRPRTWRKFPFSPTNLTILYLEMTGKLSFEQVLAYVTRKVGPLVAIGQPGSPPILGAKNIYVGDDRWQEDVIDLARRSKLVILTAGTSRGVLWEVQKMIEEVPPERLILNIPGDSPGKRKKVYAEFIEKAQAIFPAGLPEEIKRTRFLIFGEDWKPQTPPTYFQRPKKNTPPWVAKRLTQILI